MRTGIQGFAPIPGYEGRYEIDYYANIRRRWEKSGKRSVMKPSLKKGEHVIRLLGFDGKRKMHKVSHLMAMTYMQGYKKGMCVYHVNGIKTDNTYSNLKIISKKKLGELTGGRSSRKTIAKIAENGEVVAFYSSARDAARRNYMSYQAVLDCCNKKNKRRCAPDGYIYAFADNYIGTECEEE